MTPEPRLSDYLRHIQMAAEQTLGHTSGMGFDAFQADLRTQQAVLFNFVILGEASGKVMDRYPDFAIRHPEMPWRAIRNMRNRVAHGNFKIDYEVLWNTVAAALPSLLTHMPAVIAAADRQTDDPPPVAS